MFRKLLQLLYPPRCVLCGKLLPREQTEFCHCCRENVPECKKTNVRFSFLAGWTAMWYYKDSVRGSILRFKFAGRRSYAQAYGRVLAMKLQKEGRTDFDILTYVPVSFLRRWSRGYDQVALLADAVGKELGVQPMRSLQKIRNTPPQSGIIDVAKRRANVLGAYKPVGAEALQGKRILLLDDILTTGATASECARVLLTAGAKEVFCACVAVREHNSKPNKM